jgi:hypothetical protein
LDDNQKGVNMFLKQFIIKLKNASNVFKIIYNNKYNKYILLSKIHHCLVGPHVL